MMLKKTIVPEEICYSVFCLLLSRALEQRHASCVIFPGTGFSIPVVDYHVDMATEAEMVKAKRFLDSIICLDLAYS